MQKDKLIKELELGLKNPNVPDTFKDKIRVKLAALKAEEPKENKVKEKTTDVRSLIKYHNKFNVGDTVFSKQDNSTYKVESFVKRDKDFIYTLSNEIKNNVYHIKEDDLKLKTPAKKPTPKQKFKVGDVVANTNSKSVGIVRDVYVSDGEVKTDADGNVSVSELELYNPKKHKDYKMAPSTKKEIEKELSVIEILYDADSKGWSATKADSGSEIRNSEELTKKYAEAVKKALTEHGIKKSSLTEADYDILVDDNYHLLNEFLAWNRYYDDATAKNLQEMYQRIYDRGTNSAADPEAISLEPTYKPTKKKATPIKRATNRYVANREIKSVTILEDGKKVTYSGKDVLNGANFFEKGGRLSDKAKYIVKSNIVSVEFADGSKEKPENGYHIKNGAKPIMQHGGQVMLPQGALQSYQNYYLQHGGVNPDVIVLVPLQLKNLSSQLMKHTGEPYTSDYVGEDGSTRLPSPGKLLIHKPTGKKFLMPRILYNRISGYNLVYDKKNKEIVTYEDGKVVAEVVKGKLNFAFKDPSISIRKIEVEKEFENDNIPLLMETDDEMYKLGGALLSAWKRERKYVNKKEDYEVRYAKDKNRSGYKKFADGGKIEDQDTSEDLLEWKERADKKEITPLYESDGETHFKNGKLLKNDKFEKVVYLPNENEFVKIKIEHNPIFDKYIYSVDGSVMSEHKTIEEAVEAADSEGLVNYPSKDSVVGTISTGKPIFENRQATDKAYSNFTKQDHELAGKLWMSSKIDDKSKLNMTERDELSADHFRKARTLAKEENKYFITYASTKSGFDLYSTNGDSSSEKLLGNFKTLKSANEKANEKRLERLPNHFRFEKGGATEPKITPGNIVKYSKPENKSEEKLLFVVLEVANDERPRATIRVINSNLSIPPTEVVRLSDITFVSEAINNKFEKGGVLKVGDEVVDFKSGEYRGKVAEILEINADEDDIVIENPNGVLLTVNSFELLKKPNVKANLGASPEVKLSIEELKAKHSVSNYGKGGKTEGKGKGAIFEKAKQIRKPGEKWQDAVKRASQLK